MIENQVLVTNSLNALWNTFQSRYTGKKDDVNVNCLLKHINQIAATRDVLLNEQTQTVLLILFKQLDMYDPDFGDSMSTEDFALGIYNELEAQMNKESDEARRRHAAQGSFSPTKIHLRSMRDQLQDNDMTRFMPKSLGAIEVLGAINQFDKANDAIAIEGLKHALKEGELRYIMAPVGPGHWRGIYITKPMNGTDKYILELFDPYGPKGAQAIEDFVLALLEKAGLSRDNIEIKYSGPIIPQADGYACGDFTCAYSHKKMQEWRAPENIGYNPALIKVLDTKGNANAALRLAVRQISEAGKVATTVEIEQMQDVIITPEVEGFAGFAGSEDFEDFEGSEDFGTFDNSENFEDTEDLNALSKKRFEKVNQLRPVREILTSICKKELIYLSKMQRAQDNYGIAYDEVRELRQNMMEYCDKYERGVIDLVHFHSCCIAEITTAQDSKVLMKIEKDELLPKLLNSLLSVVNGLIALTNSIAGMRYQFFDTAPIDASQEVNALSEGVSKIKGIQ
ncbi:MAG: hypothetical protein ACHP6H_03335 [Legionellales bacterium]